MGKPDLNDRRVYQLMTDKHAIFAALGIYVQLKGRQWTTANALRLMAGFAR